MPKEEASLSGSQEEKISAVRQFAVGLADEMSNLLIVISGRLKILLDQKTIDEETREALVVISNCTNRLSVMANRIFKFTMEMSHKFEDLNINEVVESAITLLNYHKVYSASVNIEKDLAKDLPLVKGDFNQLQEAFLDLFLNAYQAMAGAGGRLGIKTLNSGNNYIEVKISDTGRKKKEWLDFNLLFCHKVINSLNGSIDMQDQGERGTDVVVRLPLV